MHTIALHRTGGIASVSCVIHCLLMSAAPALVSLLSLEFLAHEAFEWGFFVAAVVLALLAATLGYRLHRNPWVLLGFGSGVLVLVAGRMGEALSLYEGTAGLAVLGGGLLVASHVLSERMARVSRASCCA